MTKDRPIIFTGEAVRDVLSRRKTQTRRVITYRGWAPNGHCKECGRHQEKIKTLSVPSDATDDGNPIVWRGKTQHVFTSADLTKRYTVDCPYGKPGDRLYVREAIRNSPEDGNFYYSADDKGVGEAVYKDFMDRGWASKKTISPRFMPKIASRIILEVKSVRVERLQEINMGDVLCEITGADWDGTHYWYKNYGGEGLVKSPFESFKALWNTINEKRGYGWNANPMVWIVEFELVTEPETVT